MRADNNCCVHVFDYLAMFCSSVVEWTSPATRDSVAPRDRGVTCLETSFSATCTHTMQSGTGTVLGVGRREGLGLKFKFMAQIHPSSTHLPQNKIQICTKTPKTNLEHQTYRQSEILEARQIKFQLRYFVTRVMLVFFIPLGMSVLIGAKHIKCAKLFDIALHH